VVRPSSKTLSLGINIVDESSICSAKVFSLPSPSGRSEHVTPGPDLNTLIRGVWHYPPKGEGMRVPQWCSSNQNTCSLTSVCLTMTALLLPSNYPCGKVNHLCSQLLCSALRYCLSDKKRARDADNNRLQLNNQRLRHNRWLRLLVLLQHNKEDHKNGPHRPPKSLQSSLITRSQLAERL
jgi:hypothetical protein